jgi:ABC-type antimicrobial peptide transport system permease subunit
MWWKLSGLLVLTAALVFAVIPIRTHAVVYDPLNEPPPERGSFGDVLGNMYLTPGTVLLILCIVAVASFVAFKVVRGHW